MGIDRIDPAGVPIIWVDLLHHVRSNSGQRVVADHPGAGPRHRESVSIGGVLEIERGIRAVDDCLRCQRKEDRGNHRGRGQEPPISDHQQETDADTRPDPRAPSQCQRQRDQQRRKNEARPDAVRTAEQQPRRRKSDDQHQQPGVGHVVAHGAERPLSKRVEVQDAVLHDAVHSRGDA